jgi:plastocyanin domain-containing protein
MKSVVIFFMLISSVCFAKSAPKEYKLVVTEKGFEPSTLKVPANTPIVLKVTRKTNATCAREITIPAQKLRVDLPMDKEVTVKVAALPKGEIKFGCAMDLMIGGVLFAE